MDIAKKDVLTGDEDLEQSELMELMELALVHNRPRFVELILEKGLDLGEFFTVGRLFYLYNSRIVCLFFNFK